MQEKVYVVLTSTSKHAEFKCPRCNKIFISGHHLNSHFTRRHMHLPQERVKKEIMETLHRDSVQDKTRSHGILGASRRMEQLLKNLSLEEMEILGNGSSTPGGKVQNIEPHFSGLSPIARNEKSEFSSHNTAELDTTQEIPLVETKKLDFQKKNAMSSLQYLTTNLDTPFFVSERIVDGETCKRKEERGSILQVGKGQNTCDIVHNKNNSTLKAVEMATQTEELVVPKKYACEKENSRIFDVVCEVDSSCGIINFTEGMFDNEKYSRQGNEGLRRILPFDHKVFEQEFQKCFEARKNLLTEDDYLPDHLKSDHKRKVEPLKDQNFKEVTLNERSKTGECDNSNVISERNVQKESNKGSAKKLYRGYLLKIKKTFSARLRSAGIDPNWTSITNSFSQRTNSALVIRRVTMSKEIPEFMKVRAMLNNTANQILETGMGSNTLCTSFTTLN